MNKTSNILKKLANMPLDEYTAQNIMMDAANLSGLNEYDYFDEAYENKASVTDIVDDLQNRLDETELDPTYGDIARGLLTGLGGGLNLATGLKGKNKIQSALGALLAAGGASMLGSDIYKKFVDYTPQEKYRDSLRKSLEQIKKNFGEQPIY